MNDHQPYEKHLGDKLRQVPLPDVEPNWQQMKSLLDKEMPRGGGYWRWITAVGILLFMLGGTWFFINQKDSDSLAGANKYKKAGGPEPSSEPGTARAPETKLKKVEKPDLQSNPNQAESSETAKILKRKNIEETLPNSARQQIPQERSNSPKHPVTILPPPFPNANLQNSAQPEEPSASSRPGYGSPRYPRASTSNQSSTGNQKSTDAGFRMDRDNKALSPIESDLVKYSVVNFDVAVQDDKVGIDRIVGESIKNGYSGLFPENAQATELRSKRSGKQKASSKANALESVENRVIAVGLSLPMGFPLGDQKPGAYNINAKPNTVSDFLPVPHLQYHVNNKLYLQTELQFMNPQFIQPVLLIQNKTDFPSTNSVHYNSVYAKKLYYFNIPVGLHYSPFPHFYLGTGLQFSSLVSGVAMHEETSFLIGSSTNTLVSQRYTKFKNDTVSNRIDNSEFRLMLDANYYWKQFTVGLRYNQALSNYVSFRLNAVSPLFQDKNKSLQFYLRYNLWENYQRRAKR